MSFDGTLMHYLRLELMNNLENSRVEKITFNGNSFYFQLYYQKNRNNLKFNLTGGKSSCYITKENNKQVIEHPFINTLKKHLNGSILFDIKQISTDRVFEFYFREYNMVTGINIKILVFEATGRHSNLYLLSEDMVIIDCYRKIFSDTNRTLIPKALFKHMKSNKLSLENYIYNNDVQYLLENYDGLSKNLAQFLVQNPLINPLKIDISPILYNNKTAYFFNIFKDVGGDNTLHFETISEAFDSKVIKLPSPKDKYILFLNQQIKKINKKIAVFNIQKAKAIKDLDYKIWADEIYGSGNDLTVRKNQLNELKLDPLLTLNENAQKFYKLYHKAKRTLEHVNILTEKTYDDLTTINTLLHEIELTSDNEIEQLIPLINSFGFAKNQRKYKDQKKASRKQQRKIELTKVLYKNSIIFIGRNHVQNEFLLNNIANRFDYWFHVKDASGSHVILRTEKLDDELIRIASMLAAHFSSLSKSSSIPVDYTLVKNLKKIPKLPSYKLSYKDEKTKYIDIDINTIETLLLGH